LEAIPKDPTKIIQKVTPGPPMESAIATQAIFPSPTVADKAAVSACKCDTSPCFSEETAVETSAL